MFPLFRSEDEAPAERAGPERSEHGEVDMKRRIWLTSLPLLLAAGVSHADETCQSPYMAKIEGQEEYVYAWTLGEEGLGDGSDKLVTVDVRPGSETYGQVIHTVSVGGRHEAHHGGLSDDRRRLWLGGLDDSDIFIFDVATDPAAPRLEKTITDFVKASGGVVGPHGIYALPGRMIISGLSNDEDHGGRTALVEYSNEGEFIATHWMPTAEEPQGVVNAAAADGFGYDVRVLPRRNVMLTSSFAGWSNYMMDFGQLMQDAEAMKHFGQTCVVWNLHTKKPEQVLEVPGAPLEIRFAWGEDHDYAFTASALTSELWLVHAGKGDRWEATDVAHIGPAGEGMIPVAISLSADDKTLFVTTFADGKCRVYDVEDPYHPSLFYEKVIGRQLNMVSQSWDGNRVYFTSSLLSNWDKKGEDNEQFLKAFTWDGKELAPEFAIDFTDEKLGRPHLMRFGSGALYE
jgi:selenium-binding protein 1